MEIKIMCHECKQYLEIVDVAGMGPGFNEPFTHLLSSLTTLLGVFLAKRIIIDRYSQKQNISKRKETVISTGFSVILRVLIMVSFVFLVLRLFFVLPEGTIIALLPLVALYDAVVVAYTVPVAYLIETKIKNRVL